MAYQLKIPYAALRTNGYLRIRYMLPRLCKPEAEASLLDYAEVQPVFISFFYKDTFLLFPRQARLEY